MKASLSLKTFPTQSSYYIARLHPASQSTMVLLYYYKKSAVVCYVIDFSTYLYNPMGLGTMSQIVFVFPAQCGTRYISCNCLLNRMEELRLSSSGTDLLYMQSGYLWWLQLDLTSYSCSLSDWKTEGKKGRERRKNGGRKQWSEEVLWVTLVFWVMWMRRAGMGVLDQLGHRNLLCMTPKIPNQKKSKTVLLVQWNARGESRLGSQHCTFIVCMQAENCSCMGWGCCPEVLSGTTGKEQVVSYPES